MGALVTTWVVGICLTGADGGLWPRRLEFDKQGVLGGNETPAGPLRLKPMIVGGVEVPRVTVTSGPLADGDSFPDVVAVGDAAWHCSGVLVSERLVVTARHCLPASRVSFTRDVAAGPGRVVSIRCAHVPDEAAIDVAALFLAEPVSGIPLRAIRTAALPEPAGELRVVGFGVTRSGARKTFGRKRMADVLAAGWGCTGARTRALGCLPDAELVVLPKGGTDTCDGDSGGPALERHEGKWRLVGVTSRGFAMARGACGRGGIATRTDRVWAWLEGLLKASPDAEVCR